MLMTTTDPRTTSRPLPTPRVMYNAVVRQDASYDGLFYTGVRTTGIFCRPSCRARRPEREYVEFFSAVADALFAGYRACLRWKLQRTVGAHPWPAHSDDGLRRLRGRAAVFVGNSGQLRLRWLLCRTYGGAA